MKVLLSKMYVRLALVVVSHYAGLLPVALFGVWANYLIPSVQWVFVLPHLILMAILTLCGVRSAKLLIAPAAFILFVVLFTYPQISVILADLKGDWMRLAWGFTGPVAYLIISSVAFFLLNQRYGEWAELELARERT